jgi:hypothetical protein
MFSRKEEKELRRYSPKCVVSSESEKILPKPLTVLRQESFPK